MTGSRGTSAPDKPKSLLGLRRETLLALVAIAVLLVPLSALSQPADSTGPGGYLARLRNRFGLSQANLGEVDPTSETMRLATLGLKNVAVTLLWDRANHYKKVEDWTNLSAALEQMTKLQPNFYSVWDFQAHNLSYNISVEFDDYHDRYAWVMKGIEFLRQGISLNQREPRLLGRMGWFIGQKIGRADEKKQFRRLFKADDDFHERDRPGRTLPERDNWLVAREKYLAAQQLADSGAPLKTTALIFHSEPMMTAINYARALEDDGVFGDAARDGWKLAGDEMRRFSVREIPTTWDVPIRLGLREAEQARAERLAADLEKLLPGRFKALEEAKRAAVTPEQKAALDTPPIDRSEAQQKLAAEAESGLQVTWPMVVREAPADVRDKAQDLARQYIEARETADIIDRYRDIVNFDFWRATCETEVTEPALRAREAAWRAEREFENARLQTARKAYEEAFVAWREVLDASPVLRDDQLTADDLAEIVGRYRKVLEQLDEKFPKPFILQDVLDRAGPLEE
jgi:tetratricopeptide (TPR) repeat protein